MNITISKNIDLKQTVVSIAVIIIAYQIGRNLLVINSIAFSTLIKACVKIGVLVLLLSIVIQWMNSPRGIKIGYTWNLFDFKKLTLNQIVLTIVYILLFCLPASVLIVNYSYVEFIGISILFLSSIGFLIIGLLKPELGPVSFLFAFPFLAFTEARLSADWGFWIIQEENQNVLTRTIFSLSYSEFVILFFTIGIVINLIFIKKHQFTLPKYFALPFMSILLWCLISVIISDNVQLGILGYLRRWILPISIFIATLIGMEGVKYVKYVKWLSVGFTFLLLMVIVFTIQHAVFYGEHQLIGSGERAKIWSVIYGQVSPWIILCIPIIVSIFVSKEYPAIIRFSTLFVIFLVFIMILWEFQRSVLVTLPIMCAIYYIVTGGKRIWKFILFITILGFLGRFFLNQILEIVYLLRPSFLDVNPWTIATNMDRWYLWNVGIDIIKNNPLFGVGHGVFETLKIGYWLPESSLHVFIMDLAVDSGIATAVFYMIMISSLLFKSIKHFYKGSNYRHDQYFMFWVISFFGFCFIHHLFHSNWNWGYGVVVFCIMGVLVGSIEKSGKLSTR